MDRLERSHALASGYVLITYLPTVVEWEEPTGQAKEKILGWMNRHAESRTP